MGCMKSKQTFPFPTTIERCEPPVPMPITEDVEEEEEVEDVEDVEVEEAEVEEVKEAEEPSEPAEPKVLVSEFANRLSEEILSGALQQWVDSNAKYADIPFIESDGLSVAQR